MEIENLLIIYNPHPLLLCDNAKKLSIKDD
jgi:hypothetical protein